MADDPVNSPRRLRGLRLRWLILAAVPAAAIAAFWASDQARRRVNALDLTRRLGGQATLDRDHIPVDPSGKPLPPRSLRRTGPGVVIGVESEAATKPRGASILEKVLGPRFAHSVSVINLDARPVLDADLAALAGLKDVEILYLNATPITDAALAHLSGLSGLRRLELRETSIGDAGIAHLAGLSNLRDLYLADTRVGDPGLASLSSMTGLRELRLGHTSVGDAGLAHLSALKGLRVLRVGHTRVGDAGLEYLTGLGDLQELDLSGTAVTDVGLASIALLKGLRILVLDDTSVTDAGILTLKKALPGLLIFRAHGPVPRQFRRPGDSLKDRC